MDLLQKFAAVEVSEDTRITEADRDFCKTHQAAYDNAKSALAELKCVWEDMVAGQKSLLSEIDTTSTLYLLYNNEIRISSQQIEEQIKLTHTAFIRELIEYFNKTYKISISVLDIQNSLLPKKPETHHWDDNSAEWAAYEKSMLTLSLQYTDILEQLFLHLDGRNLKEQAMHELLGKCRQAAWNSYRKISNFTRKKAVLQFTNYACSYNVGCHSDAWNLSRNTIHILQGIAHYETDSFSHIPVDIASVINAYKLSQDFYEFPTCKKLKSMKLFKNGRIDFRFISEECAQKFADKYLGTMY